MGGVLRRAVSTGAMWRVLTGFTRAPSAERAAEDLVAAVEHGLPAGVDPVGGLVLATAAAGEQGFEVGERLRARWPGATFAGTGFEGLLAEGRVWRGQPAIALLAWTDGPDAPEPLMVEAEALAGDEEALAHLEAWLHAAAGDRLLGADDLLLLFPDALTAPALEPVLASLVDRCGGPSVAGAAATGPGGGPSIAWIDGEQEPGAALALLVPAPAAPLPGARDPGPGGAAAGRRRLAQAVGSRFASPWLEVGRARGVWLERIEGEPATDWARRQLGLGGSAPLEPWLDHLLLRIHEGGLGTEPVEMIATDESRIDFVERYVIGVAEARGALALPEPVAKGDRIAFALPDAERARSALRAAVAGLPPAPVVLQLACRARDARLHGDEDLESALVVTEARDRRVLGAVAPFQLAPDARGRPRIQVHRSLLLAFGPAQDGAHSS